MLHDGRAIRVAVVGGSRIPFCRSHSEYRDCTNQDLMVAALQGIGLIVHPTGRKVRRSEGNGDTETTRLLAALQRRVPEGRVADLLHDPV